MGHTKCKAKVTDENQDKRISFQERMNFTIYWMVILGLVVCNFLIAMLMVPLLLVLPGASLYFTIGLLGLLFGLLFDFLIKDIEHIEKKHHLFAAILIPILSIVTIFFMVAVAEKVAIALNLVVLESPWIVSLVYIGLFMAPYIYSVITGKKYALE